MYIVCTMNWFLIGLFAPALWSLSNHIDKYLLSKYFKSGGVGALILISALFEFVVLPPIILFRPDVLDVTLAQGAFAALGGVVGTLSILVYLYAMKEDEASYVVPLFQMIPVITFMIGITFFHEVVGASQVLGSALIILGGIGLSLEFSGQRPKLKSKVFFLMLLSCFMVAVSGTIFKVVAVDTDLLTTIFWLYLGGPLTGIFFLLITSYRQEFIKTLRNNRLRVISLNLFNEAITIMGGLIFSYTLMTAPFSLAWVVNGFQPLFVFAYGIVLTLLLPRLGAETLTRKVLLQKFVTIAVILVGTYFMQV